ncbi:MAG: 50S ribosomal protein L23 [Patescibacteria group bacterium]
MSVSHIKKLVVTEKSTGMQGQGKYVFVVDSDTTKNEIRKAIETIYHVKVVSVDTNTRKPKTKRFRGVKSLRGGSKRAIVTLKKGQTIDIHKT